MKIFIACCLFLAGCQSTASPASTQSADAQLVSPPAGWRADTHQVTEQSSTRVWLSPSGDTALGEIRFSLPLPVGHDLALWGFLQNMKKSEGRADLIEKKWDDSLPALRFVAEGGRYRVRTNLFVRGTSGWAFFAGTLTSRGVNPAELSIAEAARDAARPPGYSGE